jgi:hypothetical protein
METYLQFSDRCWYSRNKHRGHGDHDGLRSGDMAKACHV